MTAAPVGSVVVFVLASCLAAGVMPAVAQVGPEGAVRVTVPRANVRSAPSLSGDVLTQVTRGTVLPVQAVEGDWYQVRVSMGGIQFEAYISSTVCERVETADPAGAEGAPQEGLTSGPPEPRHGMIVSYLPVEGGSLGLPPASARPVPIEGLEGSLSQLAGMLPAADAPPARLGDDDEVTWLWVAEAGTPAPALDDRQPRFIVSFADVPDLAPEDLTAGIVRLTPAADGRRLVGAVPGRADHASRTDDDWDVMDDLVHDDIAVIVVTLEPGTLNVQPREELPPGEYAVVVRPSSRDDLAGADVLSDRREGAVFGVVWMFAVKPR
jgi:hypothetical protein